MTTTEIHPAITEFNATAGSLKALHGVDGGVLVSKEGEILYDFATPDDFARWAEGGLAA